MLKQLHSRATLFLLFTVSGFAGLIYESIWSHYLKLFLGHAAYAQTLVLAIFMGGMALGSWLCSRFSGGWKNLLVNYALTEAVIGACALAFHPLFVAATGAAFDFILPALGSEFAATCFKWCLGTALILPQSILLGMSFPLMSGGLIRRHPDAPGASLAMLYFTNSLGAAIGVLASGFFMIAKLGLPGTIQAAGLMNLALAAAVWLLARGAEPPATAPVSTGEDGDRGYFRLLLATALLTGAASFIYEIGWIRMLSLVLGASTHSFELMLSAFIFGLACGGYWVKRRIDRTVDPTRLLGMVQVVMGLLAIATLPLYGTMFEAMTWIMKGVARSETGYVLYHLSSHAIALAIMFPATFCAGMTLPLITYALLRRGYGEKSIGAVYAANTLGAILGVFAAAQLGLPLLGLKNLIAAGAAIDTLLGVYLLWHAARARPAPAFPSGQISPALAGGLVFPVAAGGVVALALIFAFGAVQFDVRRMVSGVFRHGTIYTAADMKPLFYKDGKTATVSLVEFPEGTSIRTNAKSDGAINLKPGARISDEITMVLTAVLPLALKPEAKNAAIIGMGTGLTVHTMLANSKIETVETIEIEPAMVEAARGFSARNANAYADPRSHIRIDDAKTFFSTRNGKYDIIISEPSNPWVSGVSSLFSNEFYHLVRRYLKPGGVLVQWFQLYEIDVSLVASVLLALGDNFPDYAIYASTDNDLLIVAGDAATLAQPLADVFREPGLAKELRTVHLQNLADLQIRKIATRATIHPLVQSFPVPANSDYYPYLDLNAARYRFLQQGAGDLAGLNASSVPVIPMLEGTNTLPQVSLDGADYFSRIEQIRRAQYIRDTYLKPNPPEPRAMPRALQKDLELASLRALDCWDPARHDIWLHSLFQVANAVNSFLPPEETAAIWRRFESAGCYGSLPQEYKLWIALFKAVGARDAANMAELAGRLFTEPGDLPPESRRYLLTAAMAGYLAQGKSGEAVQAWERYAPLISRDDRSQLSLRLLYAKASGGKAPPN
jgi:predicted membrane-bound spermidine synthase